MNVLQHTGNELNLSLKQNRPDRSYRHSFKRLTVKCDWYKYGTHLTFGRKKIAARILNHAGSFTGDLPLPTLIMSVILRHWSVIHLYFTLSIGMDVFIGLCFPFFGRSSSLSFPSSSQASSSFLTNVQMYVYWQISSEPKFLKWGQIHFCSLLAQWRIASTRYLSIFSL